MGPACRDRVKARDHMVFIETRGRRPPCCRTKNVGPRARSSGPRTKSTELSTRPVVDRFLSQNRLPAGCPYPGLCQSHRPADSLSLGLFLLLHRDDPPFRGRVAVPPPQPRSGSVAWRARRCGRGGAGEPLVGRSARLPRVVTVCWFVSWTQDSHHATGWFRRLSARRWPSVAAVSPLPVVRMDRRGDRIIPGLLAFSSDTGLLGIFRARFDVGRLRAVVTLDRKGDRTTTDLAVFDVFLAAHRHIDRDGERFATVGAGNRLGIHRTNERGVMSAEPGQDSHRYPGVQRRCLG